MSSEVDLPMFIKTGKGSACDHCDFIPDASAYMREIRQVKLSNDPKRSQAGVVYI